jgi:tetratricopeptide (TPR) repeat protein
MRSELTRLRGPLLAVLCWFATLTPAVAAILDKLESLTEGSDAVVRVHFDVRVQYQRHAPTGTADLTEVFFQIVGKDLSLSPGVEEQVKTAEHGRVPAVTISYPVQPQPSNVAQVKKLVVRFSRKVTFKVRAGPTDQSIDLVFPGLAGVAPPVSGAAGAVEKDRYAITLQTVPLDQQNNLRPVPGRFQDYAVFTTRGWRGGTAVVELDLGYFDTKAEADKIRQSALREFPEAEVFDAIERKEQTLAKAAEGAEAVPAAPPAGAPPAPPAPLPPVVPAPVPQVAPITEAAPPAPEAPDTEIDKQARVLLDKARAALAGGRNEDAINLLNQLLLLPPNKSSQEAQELIGVARERAGETELARKEYELYLKLFPRGEGATRVQQRLASLAPPPAQVSSEATTAPTPVAQAPKYGLTGSLSQYYYGGQQQVNTTFLNTPTTANQQTLTSTTQSSLVSTLNLNGRYHDGSNDARLILFDTDNKSFAGSAAPGTNRLDSVYVDYRNTSYGFSAKVGRQAGVTGGLIGRFDGAILGYDLSPNWRVNVTGGVPVDTIVDTNQNFEGVYVEAQNILEHWGGDAFFMNQIADGITDRRALGGDLRYFDNARTLYTSLDYDILFMTLNAATVQGTWQLPDQTMFSLLFDDRKAPELLTSNALITCAAPSISQLERQGSPNCLTTPSLIQGPLTLDQIRDIAKQTTATSKQWSLSVTRPLSSKWQASLDGRLTNVGALPFLPLSQVQVGMGNTIPAQPGTGNVWSADLQVNGTNLYSLRDINSFTYSWLHGPQFTGNQLGYANLSGLLENRITIEPSLRYYSENDATGNHLTRITPALRFTYKVLTHVSLESQVLYERSKTEGPTQNDTTSNVFYYVGYRYDFQ